MKIITYSLLTLIALMLILCVTSCSTQKRWSKKGHKMGWIDTTTTYVYDTIRIAGSRKDTLFSHSSDSVFLTDKLFTTVYYYDTITHNNYLRTIVHNRDTTIVKEIHKTIVKEVKYTLIDHLKSVWWLPFALLLLMIIFLLIKK